MGKINWKRTDGKIAKIQSVNHDKLKRSKLFNTSFKSIGFMVSSIALVMATLVITLMVVRGISVFTVGATGSNGENIVIDPGEFFFGKVYNPSSGHFGVFWMLLNSLWVGFLTMLVAVPLSVMAALMITKFAPKRVGDALTIIVGAMAAIPSVIFGLFGMMAVSVLPAMANTTFVVVMVLTIMTMPTITIVTINTIKSVDRTMEDGSLALGATKQQTSIKVTLKAAKSGIMVGALLGLARALGEATAVSMVSAAISSGPTFGLLSPIGMLTYFMLTGYSETVDGNILREIRFAMGLILIVTIMLIFVTANRLNKVTSLEYRIKKSVKRNKQKDAIQSLMRGDRSIVLDEVEMKAFKDKRKLAIQRNNIKYRLSVLRSTSAYLIFVQNWRIKMLKKKLKENYAKKRNIKEGLSDEQFRNVVRYIPKDVKQYMDALGKYKETVKAERDHAKKAFQMRKKANMTLTGTVEHRHAFKRNAKIRTMTWTTFSSVFIALVLGAIIAVMLAFGMKGLTWHTMTSEYTDEVVVLKVDAPIDNKAEPVKHSDTHYSVTNWGFDLKVDKKSDGKTDVIYLYNITENSPLRSAKTSDGQSGIDLSKVNNPYLTGSVTLGSITKLYGPTKEGVRDAAYDLNNAVAIDGISVGQTNEGIVHSLLNTIILIFLVSLIGIPLGIIAAMFFVEFNKKNAGGIVALFKRGVESLAGVPSLIFGIVGMAIFGFMFPANLMFVAAITLSIMILPTVINTTMIALERVNENKKNGSKCLGATKLRTSLKVSLPAAAPSIMSNSILAIGRVIAESAALIMILGTTIGLGTSTLATQIYTLKLGESPNYSMMATVALVALGLIFVLIAISRFAGSKRYWSATFATVGLMTLLASFLTALFPLFIVGTIIIAMVLAKNMVPSKYRHDIEFEFKKLIDSIKTKREAK